LSASISSRARADEDPARTAFREGAALIEQTEWSSALSAFERSLAIRPHALTLYNIGVCQRFLGRSTLARATLRRALERAEASGEMPTLFLEQTRAYLAEVESKLARLTLRVSPPTARVTIDGRPLAPSDRAGVLVAGVAEVGEGRPVGGERVEVLVDPRPVVLTFSLEGHDTIELKKEPKPSSQEEVRVSMTEQPASIVVASSVAGSVVRVDRVDVGIAPVSISRPPGEHVVSIITEGYVPYESKLTLKPGQVFPLDAQLSPEKPGLTKKWWFWTGSAVLLAGVGIATYFIVRPSPQRAATDAGGLGWVAEVH
jgi:hypothetical protein